MKSSNTNLQNSCDAWLLSAMVLVSFGLLVTVGLGSFGLLSRAQATNAAPPPDPALTGHFGRMFHLPPFAPPTDAVRDALMELGRPGGIMLEGKYTAETKFPPTDHRSHRPRSWLLNGVKKVEQLRFLENAERTLGQAALQWLLADDRVASTLPNIYNEEQLVEFAKAPDTAPLTADEMTKIEQLYSEHFGIEEEPPKFKGTMELAGAAVA